MGPQEKIFRSHRSTLRVTLNVAQPNSPSPNLRFFMHAARSIEGGVGLMMVGVAPPMVTNPPDGVMALSAGRLRTKPAPRASPATHGAPKAPIGTHPTPHPTLRGSHRNDRPETTTSAQYNADFGGNTAVASLPTDPQGPPNVAQSIKTPLVTST